MYQKRKRLLLVIVLLVFSFQAFAQSKERRLNPNKKRPFKDLAKTKGFNSKQDGFIIVTTNDLTHRLKSLQKYITHKARRRGFRMYVATEDDFGKGIGRSQGIKIREFLKKVDKKLDLKYCMFIGNPLPNKGEVPMMKVGELHVPEDGPITDSSHESYSSGEIRNGCYLNDGGLPTDYFYVDLHGDWDKDGNGIMASRGDYGEGGITGQDDLWVGRIPYYGEDSDYGKAEDTDIILERSIRYDNEKDLSWRYTFCGVRQWDMIPNEVFFELDVLEPNGINYYRIKDYQDTIGFPAYDLNAHGMGFNVAKLMKLPMGYTRFGGHGHPTGMHGIGSGQVKQFLNDKYPTVVVMGGCSVGMIEVQHNLAYTLLRYHAIATHGGTRSVAGYGHNPSMPYDERLLKNGDTVGQAWWGDYATKFKNRGIGGTAYLINLYGDPTSRPFPTKMNLPYPFVVKPVEPYYKVAKSYSDMKKLPPNVLEIANNKKTPKKVLIKTTEPWLVSSKKGLIIQPNRKVKVKFFVNPKIAATLSTGMHMAEIKLSDGKGYTCRRFAYLEVPDNRMVKQFDFEVEKNQFFDTLGSNYSFILPKGKKYEDTIMPVVDGIVGKAADRSQYQMIGQMISPNLGSQTIAFWVKFNSLSSDATIFNFLKYMQLQATSSGLKLSMNDFKFWGRIEGHDYSQTFPTTWETGKWTHLAISVNQTDGVIAVYKNMKKLGEIKTKPQMTLSPKHFIWEVFDGAVDELAVYNKAITEAELKQLYYECYMDSPSPANRQRQVIPGDVKLSFASGKKLTDQRVFIYPNGNKKKKVEVKKNDKGEYIAENIADNTTYSWFCVSSRNVKKSKKTFVGPIWSFKTSKNLIPGGSFEKGPLKWKGQCEIVEDPNVALKGYGVMRIHHGGSATIKATEKIKPNHGYALKMKVRTAWKRLVHFEIFYKDGLSEKILTKRSQHVYQDRHGNDAEIDFFSFKDQPYIGKDLYVRITSDKEAGSEIWVDELTLMPYRHKSTNKKPQLVRPISELKPVTKVGNNLLKIRLNDWVFDPEGDVLTYEKVSGPGWMRVRGNEIMTNHGPGASNVGINKIVVTARDSQGASIEFTVKIKVNN